MKLIDMKDTSPKPAATMLGTEPEGEEYPWGLRITLDEATLQKLGVKELPTLDSEHKVVALACVIEASTRMVKDEKTERYVTLQIEQMVLAPAAEEDGTPESKLYE